MAIAHDKKVYDMSLGQDEFSFMSIGDDGSILLFDSRTVISSTIIFETKDDSPMIKVKWNLVNPNYLLTFIVDKNEVQYSPFFNFSPQNQRFFKKKINSP